MSANVRDNVARLLVPLADAKEQVTPEQVTDTVRIARLLTDILRDVDTLRRRWVPRRIDFEAQTIDATGTTLYRFPHGFHGPVRFWVVDWSGAAAPNLRKSDATDNRTLVLTSTSAGTATIRIEEAG